MICRKNINPQKIIADANELNGIKYCYGDLCLLQVQKKDNDHIYNNKVKDSRMFMIRCEIDKYPHKLHEVCQMRFWQGTADKENLKNTKLKSFLISY